MEDLVAALVLSLVSVPATIVLGLDIPESPGRVHRARYSAYLICGGLAFLSTTMLFMKVLFDLPWAEGRLIAAGVVIAATIPLARLIARHRGKQDAVERMRPLPALVAALAFYAAGYATLEIYAQRHGWRCFVPRKAAVSSEPQAQQQPSSRVKI